MQQLELFENIQIRSLGDFQKLEYQKPNSSDLKRLISQINFFKSPKPNDVIRRQHAGLLDRLLDFRIKYIEEMLIYEARNFEPEGNHETWGPLLHQGIQTWVGLDIQTLQTPYAEILRILQLLKLRPYQEIIDLGCAYGRMGIVVGGIYPKNKFTGFEFVKARVDEGNRVYQELNLKNAILKTQDLYCPQFEMPQADIYFIYDYGQVHHINYTLNQLREISYKRPVRVVVRGKFTPNIIENEHSWLELIYSSQEDEFKIYGV